MIPIGDSARSRRVPWMNYVFVLVNIGVFIYSLTLSQTPVGGRDQQQADFEAQRQSICYGHAAAPTQIDRFYCRWSFQPREWFDNVRGESADGQGRDPRILVTLITAIFLHAGWLHIGGNMLFLWVFGDNIEDRLGHIGYALFYVMGGAVASLIQGFASPDSVVPVVGASGAVAAVLGAYIVWFPVATIIAVIPLLFFIPLPVPAFIMIGLWFVQNLLAGYATLGTAAAPDAGVAWFAHIGGFAFGFLLILLFLRGVGGRVRPPPRVA